MSWRPHSAGGCAYFFGYGAMFFLVAAMAAASAGAVMLIREREIDHELARGADEGDDDGHEVVGVRELFKDRRILTFIASAVLFHFANAAMLPLVGQKSSDGLKDGAAVVMSACIIAAQVVMIPVALVASRLAASWGRKPVFLIGFARPADPRPALLPERQPRLSGGRAASRRNRRGHLRRRVGARRRRPDQGNGPVQLDAGALATATGVGAGLSNLVAGFVVKGAGFDAGFIMLAAIAAVGTIFFALAMPETRPSVEQTEVRPSPFVIPEVAG